MLKKKILITTICVLPLILALLYLIGFWAGNLNSYRAKSYVVIIEGWRVPEQETVQPTLLLHLTAGDIRVLADDVVVFEKEMSSRVASSFSGSRTYLISLPESVEGKTLEIQITVDGAPVNTFVEQPLYGAHDDLFHLYMYQALPALIVGSFQLLFGIVFAVIFLLLLILGWVL